MPVEWLPHLLVIADTGNVGTAGGRHPVLFFTIDEYLNTMEYPTRPPEVVGGPKRTACIPALLACASDESVQSPALLEDGVLRLFSG
jgi:hypothetical protein